MPIHAPQDTLQALAKDPSALESRSLRKDKFVFRHDGMDDDDKIQLAQICSETVSITKDIRSKWSSILSDNKAKPDKKREAQNFLDATDELAKRKNTSVPSESLTRTAWLTAANVTQLHARLMSRLMVDLAGGVMENANVHLDRYGLPLIPGSAVKGCARRMALQALHDWIAAGTDRPAEDDACAPCCEGFDTPAHMLAAIARVFGWVETDWSDEKNREKQNGQWVETTWKSDFAWACSPASEKSAPTGQNTSAQGNALGNGHPTTSSPERAAQHVRNLFADVRALLPSHKTFAGTIAFLPASPNADPGLELDVVTPHHTEYYQSNNPNAVATDTEDPIPVYFPAVKSQDGKQDYFTFPLIPLRLAADGDLALAKRWLAHGLRLFGLGAKTAAGYGWFEPISEEAKAAAEQATAIAASDYPNDATFKNLVLNKLYSPSQLNQFESQILLLQKPENAAWLEKLKASLLGKENKDLRKRLKEKDWFPKDWLPQ